MKKILCCAMIIIHCSCVDSVNNDQKIDALEERVKKPEEKPADVQSDGTSSFETRDLNTSTVAGNCHAITKKGRQCKRKAKSNGYCWQHSR